MDRAAVEVILGDTASVVDFAERISKVVADQGSPERRKRRFVLAIAQTDPPWWRTPSVTRIARTSSS